ncbi:hypothetical protein ONZ45_g4053 [Pleurotus djamor]|nr:hypothetical protein ONZ45_g4053 [Pleurotus djamor]
MEVTVTFLSPIEPSNLVRQSFPFSYVALNTTSNDGQRHSVQIYSDISGEWASGDNNSPLEWTLNTTTSSLFHCVHRSSPISMTEVNDIAEDSDVVLGMSKKNIYKRPLVSWQTGTDTILRKSFVDNGQLTSTQDNHFRAINGRDWPVFAISVDLGSILSTDSPVVYGIGLVRDPSTQVKFNDGRPDQLRSTYFWTQFKELRDGFDDFLGDYQTAYARAVGFDRKLLDEATHNVSPEYADLISLATRQALGGLEITTSQALNGSLDASDIQIFMKDIGSGGQQSRTNPVEGLFASFPMLLYLNTTWAGYALKPLLEYQYDNGSNVAAPDLGGTFPVVIAGSTSNDKRGLDGT